MDEIVSFERLADTVLRLPPSCGPVRLVTVDGPAGSGKTTFARRLGAALGAQVVSSDDFPVPWDEVPREWFRLVEEQVLGPLAAGEPGGYRRFDWAGGGYAERVEVPVAPALVLEGVSTARRTAPAALAVWVCASAEVRRARVLARDGAHLAEQWRRWWRAEETWFAADDTRARADLLVDGARVPGEFVRVPRDRVRQGLA
ncbi:AAA family ATPase [Streptosporangium sp. NPDC020072]|uniref:uridine kinase family protein n=1 Tax=Streptosporangium sp. NPDC020072 TaxID=3154788 RepID=UPI0034162687